MNVVRVESVTFRPGRSDVPAIADIDLTVDAGEIVLLRGPSGAGKSTLLRALAGLVPHFHGGRFSGRITVMGRDTRTTSPAGLARWVGSVFQDPETQAVAATVARDVALGAEHHAVPVDAIPGRVAETLARVGAQSLGSREIATLSGGERQRVALAAILVGQPRVLLLDEPTSQLDDAGLAALEHAIMGAAAEGAAVVIAEHHVERLSLPVDRAIWIENGRLAMPPSVPEVEAPVPRAPTADLLRLTAVDAGFAGRTVLADCDLALGAGEVVALHGANGSGKSTLARVVAGLHRPDAGTVALAGKDLTALAAHARYPAIGFVPQDAGRYLLRERVDDEIAFGLDHLTAFDRANAIRRTLHELDLTAVADRHPRDLSVGERERVALAAVLATDPRLLVLDEPSRGMDATRRAALVDTIRRRSSSGTGVLLITHDRAFAEAAADRHVTLQGGRLTPPEIASARAAA
jgi:energy-coupling factor transport system ATP-binding protein